MNRDLFSNSKASTPVLLHACTIVIVLAYAWLTARSLEPKFPLPPGLVREIAWISQKTRLDSREMRAEKFLEVSRVEPAMLDAERTMLSVGTLKNPVLLVIDADQPDRYSVSYDRIEISLDLAGQPGLLERAFIKVWLYQNGDPAIVSSLFRLNVVSDTLALLASGEDVEPARPWLEAAVSYAKACRASWQPLELGATCGKSDQISPFSFQPLISSLIVRSQARLPFRDRLRFIESWTKRLTDRESEIASTAPPATLEAWREWLRKEVHVLLPVDSGASTLQAAVDAELLHVSLDKSATMSVEYSFRREAHTEPHLESRNPGAKNFVVLSGDGAAELFPGGVGLSKGDLKVLQAETLVWESCVSPKLSELIDASMQSAKLMYIQNCEQTERGWAALLRGGLLQFAKAEPKLPFLQLKPDQIQLAISRGQMRANDSVAKFMGRVSQPSLLGLSSAEWRRDFQAYRPMGAIEAIEWFRETTL